MTPDDSFGALVVGFIVFVIMAAWWDEWRARRRWDRVKADRRRGWR